jgi:DNA-binding NarL/FixJ family response regulator
MEGVEKPSFSTISNGMRMTSIVIADDHSKIRRGLKSLLNDEGDFQVIGEADNGLATLDLVEKLQPDILILDLMMPELNGLEVARRLNQHASRTGIVVLSMHNNEAYVQEAMQSGAKAYVLKESLIDELVTAIREVLSGRCYLSLLLCDSTIKQTS